VTNARPKAKPDLSASLPGVSFHGVSATARRVSGEMPSARPPAFTPIGRAEGEEWTLPPMSADDMPSHSMPRLRGSLTPPKPSSPPDSDPLRDYIANSRNARRSLARPTARATAAALESPKPSLGSTVLRVGVSAVAVTLALCGLGLAFEHFRHAPSATPVAPAGQKARANTEPAPRAAANAKTAPSEPAAEPNTPAEPEHAPPDPGL
jgi:hypothetical protein